jgi:hypothetical protein
MRRQFPHDDAPPPPAYAAAGNDVAAEEIFPRENEIGGDRVAPAEDLDAVERLLGALDRELPHPFVFPHRSRHEAREEASPNAPALQAWAIQPLPNMPSADGRGGFLAWLFLAAGLMSFACGGVMLAWSVAAARPDLWALGIPLALGGLGAIVFGLLGLVEAAVQRHKNVAAALEEHRQRLTMMQNLALVTQASPASRRRAA